PSGSLGPHQELIRTLRPEERRRFFLLVHFSEEFSPDVGRKTMPAAVEPLVAWLEYILLERLTAYKHRLLPTRERAPRGAVGFDEATAEIYEAARELREKRDRQDELPERSPLRRAPSYEPEVVAIFAGLLGAGLLPGYDVIAIPGASTRYDGLFDFAALESTP